MAEDELDLDAEFGDLGIDSLLSLTIATRLQDELNLEVPTSTFSEYPTIRAFIGHLGGADSADVQVVESSLSSPTQTSEKDDENYSTDATSADEGGPESDSDPMKIILSIIAEETGTALEEISSGSSLSELGVDSLLGLTIMGRLSEDLDKQLPAGLFNDSETLEEVEASLRELGLLGKATSQTKTQQQPAPTKEKEVKPAAAPKPSFDATVAPHATSVLLQGSSRAAKKMLFLFPDGAGSASSYHALADISPDVAVYGLNCPWLRTPQDLQCTLEQYVAKFLIEAKRRQPTGPYYFGGASAGGILAYEAAQQLDRAGEHVDTLVLLDTPNPVGLENPNQRMYDFLDSMNMFGLKGQAPKWLRAHFDAFLVLLDGYDVKKFAGVQPPTTNIIYARDGMCKNPEDPRPEIREDDPREMLWLINNRTDFSGAGWNSLVGKENLNVSVVDNVNHYTIMQGGAHMQEMCARIAIALEAGSLQA